MALHGVDIQGCSDVRLPLCGRPVAGGELLLVAMRDGSMSGAYCFLDDLSDLGWFVAAEVRGGTRRFEVMTAREYLSRICIWRMPCAPTE